MSRLSIAVAVGCVVTLGAGTARAAATPQQKCQVAKLKAQGALQTCLTKNSGNVILGKADASAACRTKFTKALAKAGTCRYIDNGDGTVGDLNTGLVWEKKDNLDGTANTTDPHDADNRYTWCVGTFPNCAAGTDPPDGTAYTDFLGKLNGGTSSDLSTITGCFASHCDWRLPTIVELKGIRDLSAATGCVSDPFPPCIDPTFGPTQSDLYWSATTIAGQPILAWSVGFFNGGGDTSKPDGFYVRAVRGGL